MHHDTQIARNLANGLSRDFHGFLNDVEDLVKQASTATGDELTRVKAKLDARIGAAKDSVSAASADINDRAHGAATATNKYVHEQPWKVISIGAGLGLLLGFLLTRRV